MSNSLNTVCERYVVHHKQIERRMDGSSGGTFCALLETVAKDGYYFSGTVTDDQLHVHHIVTNNPEEITALCGYHPTESETHGAFVQIKGLLAQGEKVLFCGTSQQCQNLLEYVGNRENLILVDMIHTPFVKQEMVDEYIKYLEEEFNSKISHIRYYNREFRDIHAKRIRLTNGRTVFTEYSDLFDEMELSGNYTIPQNHEMPFEQHIGDLTIAAYDVKQSESDNLGYTYVSVNSEKGQDLFEKTKKRLVVVYTGQEVDINRIHTECHKLSRKPNANPGLIRKYARVFYGGLKASQWKLKPFFQFIKLNFLTKGVHTDFKKNGIIYIHPNCAIKLVNGFSIELNGPLHLGTRRIKSSKIETRLRMERGSRLIVKRSCSFGAGSNVEIYKNAVLEVGKLNSNAELTIICGEHISLGTPCNIARNASIRDTSGHLLALPGYKMTKPLVIGNHTWICSDATVMPGANVGDGSVIGANSFVTKKVPAFTITQGNPAIEVGEIKYFRI